MFKKIKGGKKPFFASLIFFLLLKVLTSFYYVKDIKKTKIKKTKATFFIYF